MNNAAIYYFKDVLIKCGLSGDPKAISLAPDSTFSRYGATKEEIEQIKMYFSKNEILQFRSSEYEINKLDKLILIFHNFSSGFARPNFYYLRL